METAVFGRQPDGGAQRLHLASVVSEPLLQDSESFPARRGFPRQRLSPLRTPGGFSVVALPQTNVSQGEPCEYGRRVQCCCPAEFIRCLVQLFLFKQHKTQTGAQITVIRGLNGQRPQRRFCFRQPSFRRHPQCVVDRQILCEHGSRKKQKSGCRPVHIPPRSSLFHART